MNAGSQQENLDRSDDERSLERRRWFEQVVMFPVAIGMLSAAIGFVAHDIFEKIFGINPSVLDHEGPPLAIVSAVLSVSAFVIATIRWRRR